MKRALTLGILLFPLACGSSSSSTSTLPVAGSGAAGVAGANGDPAEAGHSGSNEGAATEGGAAGAPAVVGGGGGADAAAAGAGGQAVAGSPSTLIWPNEMSHANSDVWLQQNHDRITQLRPSVLVIDLEQTPGAQAQVDKHVAALKEASSPHKYKAPAAQPALAYQLLKIVQAPKGASIDYKSWNTQAFADERIQIKDPAEPSGRNLTLCELFEKGIVNEIWCMASSSPKCGETQEQKQVYDENGLKVTGQFRNVSNGDSLASLGCKVSPRITDFNSGRGIGCHQHALGHAWERYIESNAVPALAKQGRRFLNLDLDARLGAPFSSFYAACNSNSMQLTDCIQWSSAMRAVSGLSASQHFDIADLSGGCGNAHFYANTTGTYSYDAKTPDPVVLSSCENYGLHNGPGGKDLTTPYTNAMTDAYFKDVVDDDCGGHGTTYLYQNFPGPGTTATNDDGTPMHNWWVYLFY